MSFTGGLSLNGWLLLGPPARSEKVSGPAKPIPLGSPPGSLPDHAVLRPSRVHHTPVAHQFLQRLPSLRFSKERSWSSPPPASPQLQLNTVLPPASTHRSKPARVSAKRSLWFPTDTRRTLAPSLPGTFEYPMLASGPKLVTDDSVVWSGQIACWLRTEAVRL